MTERPPRSFDPPQEPEWHRRIAEAAYCLAQKRGFLGTHALDDWLAAEQQVRQEISPIVDSEVHMNKPTADRPDHPGPLKSDQTKRQRQSASRFEKFAATQAAGDGIEGDVLKPGKSTDEKLGANMADRK